MNKVAVGIHFEYLSLHNFNAEHDLFPLNSTGKNPVGSACSRCLFEILKLSLF